MVHHFSYLLEILLELARRPKPLLEGVCVVVLSKIFYGVEHGLFQLKALTRIGFVHILQ